MTREIFGTSLDRHVDAAFMRRKEQGRGPSIVHNDAGASRVRCFGNGWNVLHFKTLRAGRLGEDSARVGSHQRRDGSPEEGIVIGYFNPYSPHYQIAELPRRPVYGIGDEDVV